MASEPKNLDVAFPYSLALKHFMHWYGLAVNRSALVQLLNRYLQPV